MLNAVFQVIDTKSGDCREGRCTVLKKAEAMGIESADLDDLIHELMANCAAYGELGGKELLRRLTEIAKEKRSG